MDIKACSALVRVFPIVFEVAEKAWTFGVVLLAGVRCSLLI
jgi:hypothetical protein